MSLDSHNGIHWDMRKTLFFLKGNKGGQENEKTLADLLPGERAAVLKLNLTGRLRRRLMDIGLIEGTEVECVGISPLGDPSAYLIRETVVAIRHSDGQGVLIG